MSNRSSQIPGLYLIYTAQMQDNIDMSIESETINEKTVERKNKVLEVDKSALYIILGTMHRENSRDNKSRMSNITFFLF